MKKFKNKSFLVAFIFILSLSLIASGCGGGSTTTTEDKETAAPAAKTYTMKVGSVEPLKAPQNQANLKFKESVEKYTNGNVKVEVYPASQLGNARAQIEATQLGTQQAVLLPNSNFVGFYPGAAMTDLPFLFPSREVCYAVMDGEIGKEYLKGYQKASLYVPTLWESGFKQYTGNFVIDSPDDYIGKKIRVMENPVLIAQFQAMGASAVPINFAETYNALQQGVVDGQENPMSSIYDMKFHEVQKSIALSDHGWLPLAFAINKAWYDSLPKEYQEAIDKAAADGRDWLRAELKHEEEATFLPGFEKAGLTIVKLTPEQKAAFEAKIKEPTRAKLATMVGDEEKAILAKIDAKVKELSGK